jgi:hypothetical protein
MASKVKLEAASGAVHAKLRQQVRMKLAEHGKRHLRPELERRRSARMKP